MKENDFISQAIQRARGLRAVVIKAIAAEKELEDFERKEADYEASDERMEDIVSSFSEASSDEPVMPGTAVELLAQIDQLIYSLMDMEPAGEGWRDEDAYEKKEVMKLKEIVGADEANKLGFILAHPI
tara:strand:- start:51 stop:434 length:384 start_codon:yes stop_codon:yes gene_type:complete